MSRIQTYLKMYIKMYKYKQSKKNQMFHSCCNSKSFSYSPQEILPAVICIASLPVRHNSPRRSQAVRGDTVPRSSSLFHAVSWPNAAATLPVFHISLRGNLGGSPVRLTTRIKLEKKYNPSTNTWCPGVWLDNEDRRRWLKDYFV